MVVAKPFNLRCPRCKQIMKSFTEIIFVENFTIIVSGICCGYEITSGEVNILECFPRLSVDEKTH